MEEIVALFSICLLTGIGWVAAKLCFAKIISDENCIYFAPALGAGICGLLAYAAVHSYQPWLIGAFCIVVGLIALLFRKRLRSGFFWSGSPAGRSSESSLALEHQSHAAQRTAATTGSDEPWQLFRFTALTVLALYGMQIVLYGLFSRVYPGGEETWSLFNMTGTSPPDQMFAWHQAMFADQHRQYPQDAFYADMDFYDRPQLGGYITLFFFKLWRLPLTEDHFVYPPNGLHFYHCLWWLLNNLYLIGVAPLFRKLFGYRAAIIAVATTALGGFFFVCTAGSWMKFAGAYPLLLAFLLYLENQGPALQAGLCAMSYYIHGSVLPFIAGFGLLQVANLRYPIAGRLLSLRRLSIFAATSAVLVGAWFVVVRLVGSRQPLLYYYLYGAGLTDAQTKPVAELARSFYDKHTWASLTLSPVRSLFTSYVPVELLRRLTGWFSGAEPVSAAGLANVSFASQRFCIECALALTAAPIVVAGVFKTLARKHAGLIALCLYLVPTLMIALLYRTEWAFSLHILIVYHTLCLLLWVAMLDRRSTRVVTCWLAVVAFEGMFCVLFAELRFLPANGLHLTEMPVGRCWWPAMYFLLVLSVLAGAAREIKRVTVSPTPIAPASEKWRTVRVAGLKILVGLAIAAGVIGLYSIYCLRFYPR